MKKHFSHPHPLKLYCVSPDEEYEADVVCSGCEQALIPAADPVYTCTERDCEFFLHKSCSELARHMEHKSHTGHELTLLSEPPERSIYYNCNACGDLINGFSFRCINKSCHEEEEDFKLHVKCAFLAESVDSKAHKHTLSVEYYNSSTEETTTNMVLCDVCEYCLTEGYWFYGCKECHFRTHLVCAITADGPPDEAKEAEAEAEEEEEEVEEEEEDLEGLTDEQRLMLARIKAQDQMAMLQFQMQMAQLNAQSISNLFRF
ncbi:protein VACUOLELESS GAMETOPHYTES-like [Henckelia pumila]|uniref:protein VACUOLELESS GAMETOPHYTES-like n=1 Tax=Henckelia pumila TaxID=405737 RepID=UPI003C6E81B6